MKKAILSGALGLWLAAWVANAEQNIHAFLQWWDGKLYASTFAEDASRAMNLEWTFEWEVCWATKVSDLPQDIQDVIFQIWWDVEQVRECTRESFPMDDI